MYTDVGKPYKRSYCEKLEQQVVYIDTRGYKRYINSNKLVHRHVAEKYILGRKLRTDEIVHHKNRNKLDNRVSNLQVTTNGIHTAKHVASKILTGKK